MLLLLLPLCCVFVGTDLTCQLLLTGCMSWERQTCLILQQGRQHRSILGLRALNCHGRASTPISLWATPTRLQDTWRRPACRRYEHIGRYCLMLQHTGVCAPGGLWPRGGCLGLVHQLGSAAKHACTLSCFNPQTVLCANTIKPASTSPSIQHYLRDSTVYKHVPT